MVKDKIRMSALIRLLGIFFLFICSSFAQDRTWETFSPENGVWSILAPGVLTPDKEAAEPDSMMGSYSYTDANGFFAVIYRDTPKGRLLWSPLKKAHFKKVRKDFIKSNRGTLLKDQKFSNGAVEGREVYIKVPDGIVLRSESQVKTKFRVQRLRMFFDDRRFYLLLAVLPEGEIDAPAINNYFNSFVLKQN
jgi:hypothetical protein